MTVLRGGAATDVGRVRSNNQDQLLVAERLFAVADGMGGHAGGEVASLAAVEALQTAFAASPSADGLAEAVRNANQAVWGRAQQDPELRGMGTTLTAVALVMDEGDDDDLLAVVNVGDSRAYLLRDGELEQLTEDHSVPEELRRAGRLSDAEAASHPQRNVLTRALGIDPQVDVDCFQVTPYRGDRLMLASDGLYNEVDESDIAVVLRRIADPEKAAEELVKMAREHGGNDNITVVVVDVVDDDSRSARASAAVANEPPPAARRPPDAAPRRSAPVQTPASAGALPTGRAAGHPRRGRGVTLRAVLFVGVVIAVLGAGVGATAWYGRAGYFVGARGDEVVIFKGRPGGLLWFKPTVAEPTGAFLSEVLPGRAEDIRAGKEYGSIGAARLYVSNVTEEATPTTTTSLPSSPSTTVAPPAPVL
ncbi:MAG: Stp1/IreP family PP2C-type Ser/Thr phosphatase [Acidimicrobiales bacterium]